MIQLKHFVTYFLCIILKNSFLICNYTINYNIALEGAQFVIYMSGKDGMNLNTLLGWRIWIQIKN